VNKEKIIIMTKLAVYDKKYGEQDKLANEMFYRDYVYRRNFLLRTFAGVGCIIPATIYLLVLVLSEDMDFFNFDFVGYGINIFIITVAIMLFYTIIGTIIATKEYKNIKIRLQKYFGLIKKLEEI